jgi:hypothetical protein
VASGKNLLDVVVGKVDNAITIRPYNTLDSIWENYLSFSRVEKPLDFVVVADNFFMHCVT